MFGLTHNVTLVTSATTSMTDSHATGNICKDYHATLKLLDITGKNLAMVHDRGSNLVKACSS